MDDKQDQLSADISELKQPELPEGFHARAMARLAPRQAPTLRVSVNTTRTLAAAACAVFIVGAAITLPTLTAPPAEPQAMAALAGGAAGTAADGAMGIAADSAVSTAADSAEYAVAEGAAAPRQARAAVNAANAANTAASVTPAEEMVVKRYSTTITAQDPAEAMKRLSAIGQTQSQSAWGAGENAGGYVTLVVTAAEYDGVISLLPEIGDVTYADETQYSTAAQAADLRASLTAKRAEYDRLTNLLNGTTKINDMLTVETRLTQVIYDIDNCQSQLSNLLAQANAPTISVSVQAPQTGGGVQPVPFIQRVEGSFSRSISAIVSAAQGLALAVSFAIVPVIIIAAIATVVFLIVKRRAKK